MDKLRRAVDAYEWAWEQRDTRVDGFVMMRSVIPTLALCLGYVYIVKVWGPNYMRDRPPFQIRDGSRRQKCHIFMRNEFKFLLSHL